MKKIIFLLFMSYTTVFAQKIFISSINEGIKVFITQYENQADLKIYFVLNINQAGWINIRKKHLLE